MHDVVWHMYLNCSGYSTSGQDFVKSLMRNEYPVYVDKEDYKDNYNFAGLSKYSYNLFHALQYRKDISETLSVWNFPPPQFKNVGKINIGYADYEVTKMPDKWVTACNSMDAIWTSSEFCHQVFVENGVKKDISVIPHTIDSQIWHPNKTPMDIINKRGFCFLFVSEWMPRKGIEQLLRAWFQAFDHKDDVCLVLKTYLGAHRNIKAIRDNIVKIRNEFNLSKDRCAPILLYSDFIRDDMMPHLFKAADVLVAPSLGEGFGLCVAQAQMMGIPVIATNWSALQELCNNDLGYMIDIDGMEDVSKLQIELVPAYKDAQWAKINMDSLIGHMQHVYNNPHELNEKSPKCIDSMQRLSYENVGKNLINHLDDWGCIDNKTDYNVFFNPENGNVSKRYIYNGIRGVVNKNTYNQIDKNVWVDYICNKKYCKVYYDINDPNNYDWVKVT